MSPEATPLPLLLLLLLAANSESTASTLKNTGREFIVVFPENIAYYHPTPSQNKVWITTLKDNTDVTINGTSHTLNKGTQSFTIRQELWKLEVSNQTVISHSNQTVLITSNKDIVVQAFSSRKNSMQTAVVIPTKRLGTKYFIPPTDEISAAANIHANITNQERGPFRLIIVNTNQNNSVNVSGAASKAVSLLPRQVAQIPITDEASLEAVEAEKPVAVLVGHPCANRPPCSCGLLYAMLQPARSNKTKFPIPPALVGQAEASVLLTESGSSSADAFNPDSAEVETSGTAVLYRQDLLLTLISEKDFASCYVATKISANENYIVIVVDKDEKDGIHVGEDALQSDTADWKDLNGTHYKTSGLIPVSAANVVVWHESSRMGVYYMGKISGTWFAHPAPIISTTPDFRGCAMTPEVLDVSKDAGSWQGSITSCSNDSMKLIHLSEDVHQKQVCRRLAEDDIDPWRVWIGMRRSSQTGSWYWLDKDTVPYTNWGRNEPGSLEEGQCAVMRLKSNSCTWRDEECCSNIRPLCYKDPVLLEL